MTRISIIVALLAFTLTACDSVDTTDEIRVETNTVADLPADPGTRDNTTGQVTDTGQYTLYSLRDNEIVLAYNEDDRSDSTSTAWDIGFQGSTIIVNGGASGPGMGAAVILEEAYDDVTAVPAGTSFRVDGSADCPSVSTPGGTFPGSPLAVCTGSGNGWYTYTGTVAPLPGKTLVVRLADGSGLAKLRFVSYTLSEPLADGSRPRYYTFEHARLP